MTSASRPSSTPTATALGFLTVLDNAKLGFVGGYLLLNAQARPLEFHCTAPVVANRAQQILYGPTLGPYLIGEQIGVALAERAKQKPRLIVTDCKEVLNARRLYDVPILLAHEPKTPAPQGAFRFSDSTAIQSFTVSPDFPRDESEAQTFVADESATLDWCEPFERIREAISEAQRPAAA